MAVGTIQQQPATVQIERSVLLELKRPEAESFLYPLVAITDTGHIELWGIHIPESRLSYRYRSSVVTLKHPLAIGCKNLNLQQILLVDGNRVSTHIDTYIFDILLGHIQQIDVTIEATIKTEIREIRRYHLHIATVIAAHHHRQSAIAITCDINRPTVVATHMCANQHRIHIHLGLLSCAFKLQ